ncbi:MAG: hypothetical protein AB2L11_06890 [Syntrophobacteraceae bacterium]
MKLCVSRVAPAPPPVGLPLLQLWKGITDPESRTTTYTYDPVGRVTSVLRPDNSTLGFSYDLNGNMKVLTNPAVVDHGFGYNRVNLNTSYYTPLSGSYAYHYDRDRRLVSIDYPSGKQLRNIYENGRLTHVEAPEGNTDFSYLCSSKVEK